MNDLTVSVQQLPDNVEDLAKFVLVGREKLKAVRAEINAIQKVGLAKEVLEQKRAEAQEIAELVTLSEVKIGSMLNEIPKAAGGDRGNQYTGGKIRTVADFGKTKKEVLAEIGIKQDTAERFQQMAKHEDIVHAAIEEARENNDIINRSTVLNKIKEAERAEKEQYREEQRIENADKIERLSTPLEAQGLFQTIVIDPPWDWSDEGDINQLGRAKPDYHTMSIEEIAKMPINRIADDNCHLYLWITNRSLPKGFRLINEWGFRYITCITWVKPSFGMGNYFRGSTEQVLFAVKGSQLLKRKDVGTHFEAPRGKGHSAKPNEFYNLVENCSYAPYIDIFGRKDRSGWSVWGENG